MSATEACYSTQEPALCPLQYNMVKYDTLLEKASTLEGYIIL